MFDIMQQTFSYKNSRFLLKKFIYGDFFIYFEVWCLGFQL